MRKSAWIGKVREKFRTLSAKTKRQQRTNAQYHPDTESGHDNRWDGEHAMPPPV